MTLKNTESYNLPVPGYFATNLCEINPHPLELLPMLKRIFKFLWRLILALGTVGLLGILIPRLITTFYAMNRIYQTDEAPSERLAIVFGAGLRRRWDAHADPA